MSKYPPNHFALKHNEQYPGQNMSMDHFKVPDCGRLYTSMGKTHPDTMYSGGCIFVNHATSFVHIEHLVNLTAIKTIQANKCCFEESIVDLGVIVQAYQSDNGFFLLPTFFEGN